jgi:metal-responsive CopG/Arc/MetJ family transcriptional regulator
MAETARGVARTGDAIEKITVTIPAALLVQIDDLVIATKRSGLRSYNRSALVQSALEAFVQRLRETNSDR